ncbi:MAG: hypothetical protein ABI432_18665 [Flavobacteriales bacterium]
MFLFPLIACSKGDKVASFVDIPVVTVQATEEQGGSTSKITDAWVSVDDHFLGVWELPAHVPILAEGDHRITVVPAIKRNGTFDDRLRYPYYNAWNGNAYLIKDSTASVQPTTTYLTASTFWVEPCSDPIGRLNVSDDSDTLLLPPFLPDPALDNTTCRGFVLDAAHPYIRIYTDEDFDVYGGPVFMELDYRTDLTLTVGILYNNGSPASDPWVTVAPTLKSNGSMPWNKIYIDLSTPFNSGISQRDIYIEARLPSGQASATGYIDNLKILRLTP